MTLKRDFETFCEKGERGEGGVGAKCKVARETCYL